MTITPPNASFRTPTSTIVQLLYADVPHVSFAGLLGHLCETLCGKMKQNARLAVVNGQSAHLDMPHHRLSIALHKDVPGAAEACLTLGIGPAPHGDPQELNDAQIIASQTAMASKLTDAVTSRLPADQVLWHIAPQVLNNALIEDLLAQLPNTLPRHCDMDDQVDLSRVMAQVQVTLSGKDMKRPKAVPQKQAGGPGFSDNWPAGHMSVKNSALRKRPRTNGLALRAMPPVSAPANDTPALPLPNHKALLRAYSALHHGKNRAATRLILSAGQSAQKVVAFLPHAC